jgi:hypothetical protein
MSARPCRAANWCGARASVPVALGSAPASSNNCTSSVRHSEWIAAYTAGQGVVSASRGSRVLGSAPGRQQQSHALDVPGADRRGERGGLNDVRHVRQQQPQTVVVVVAEAGQVQVVVVGHRAAVQQQSQDRRSRAHWAPTPGQPTGRRALGSAWRKSHASWRGWRRLEFRALRDEQRGASRAEPYP